MSIFLHKPYFRIRLMKKYWNRIPPPLLCPHGLWMTPFSSMVFSSQVRTHIKTNRICHHLFEKIQFRTKSKLICQKNLDHANQFTPRDLNCKQAWTTGYTNPYQSKKRKTWIKKTVLKWSFGGWTESQTSTPGKFWHTKTN